MMQGVVDGNLFDNIADINTLPDEVLVNIVSFMSIKDAARTSVIGRRWQYLWRFVFRTLLFDFRDVATARGYPVEVEKFVSFVNTVLELHQGRHIEGLVILFEGMHEEQYDMIPWMSPIIDSWVYFAVRKEVERFELRLSVNHEHEFPSIQMLKSHSLGGTSPFSRLTSLILVEVRIADEVVHNLLASCPNLKHLCIWDSSATKNLQVVDPPSLRVLDLKRCLNIQSLEISAESLVSLAYTGKENDLQLTRIPNLRELAIGNDSFLYFVRQPKELYCSLHQLVKLKVDLELPVSDKPLLGLPDLPQLSVFKLLEVRVCSLIGRSLLFFTSLIKASPQLCEFRIKISYIACDWYLSRNRMPFPAISAAEAVKFDHKSLKVVEMCGYVGCSSEEELLLELFKNASLIEVVVIDTWSEYYDDPELATCIANRTFSNRLPAMGATTRAESKERAKHFVSTLPHQIKFIVS